MSKKTILLTGATGYLGSNLLKLWISKGYKIVILKRSTSSLKRIEDFATQFTSYDLDRPQWETAFEVHKIDVIIHVAASYGRDGESLTQILEANTIFPIRLLELGIRHGVKSFVNTASSLPKNINPYSLSKAQFQEWLFFKKSEIHNVNLVLEYFYGPGDDDWKFISMVVKKLLNNEPSIDFTSGHQKRDFIYIEDVISAYDKVLDNLDEFQSGTNLSIGSGESYTLRSVVELSKKVFNNSSTDLKFGTLPDRIAEIPDQKADISVLKTIGWNLNFPLERGLKEFIL
jgi:CDP-paratose synthetase